MDYEKKYKEALEKARKIKRKIMSSHLSTESCKAVSEYIDTIIPELHESEDERIRKEIIHYILYKANGVSEEQEHMWVTYLKKQKPIYNLEIPAGDVAPAEEDGPFDEDEFLEDELSAFLQNYDKEYDDDVAVSDVARHFYEIGKKQKEQKHPNGCFTCDEYKKGYEEGRRNGFTAGYNKAMKEVEQKEQNGEDEECTDFTIYHPLKNGKGEYECIPYSFYGSLTSFSKDKDLIDFLRTCFYTKEECEKWIKKQKEQEPVERWQYVGEVDLKENREEKKPNIELIQKSWYMEGYHDRSNNKESKWIIKTGEGGPRYEENPKYGQIIEQKPAEWSKEDKQKEQKPINNSTREKIISRATSEKQVVLISESSGKAEIDWDTRSLGDAKKLLECGLAFINKNGIKPAEWNPEDEQNLNVCLSYIKDEPLRNWLKDAIHVRYDKLAEWSEEDEDTYNRVYCLFRDSIDEWYRVIFAGCYPKITKDKVLAMLKSLRPSWRPSDEQLRPLEYAIDYFKKKRNDTTYFESLYNDLKKLM